MKTSQKTVESTKVQPAGTTAGEPKSDVGVIPVAYAIVSAGSPGEFYAVRLHGVMAEHVEHLVPGATKATKRAFALQRVMRFMQIDCVKKLFG